jgi:YD repeat-containing protein
MTQRGTPSVTYLATYDNSGRITSADNGSSIAKFAYQYEDLADNISKMTYDHRTNDPCTDFTYDNLDRLTMAGYGIEDNNEIFTMDDLGNRTNVNQRDGSDEAYSVDNENNRYNSVGGVALEYDDAGNLAEDKDDYTYSYDYENRIVKIEKPNGGGKTTVAQYAYDALGRRIRKIDSIASSTTVYYNNNSWQVLSEYDGSNNFQRSCVYGNYIDEVLMMTDSGSNDYYYAHDHLFSPAALIDDNGTVVERYEYDAYGDCNVLV